MIQSKTGRFGTQHQTSWDWRAAVNFIGGGSGSALLAIAVASHFPAVPPLPLILLALALIGVGLLSVWAEIGRPWRAFNVLFHPQTSWMTREAFVAGLIGALSVAAMLFGLAPLAWAAGAAGLVFLYCQGRILRAARGIPAWREPAIVWLIIATGLTEGCALLVLANLLLGTPDMLALTVLLALSLLRLATWLHYKRRMFASDAPQSTRRALQACDRVLVPVGSLLAVALLVAALLQPALMAAAGSAAALAALGAGWYFKSLLITRAAQVQGYALGNKLRRGHPLAQTQR
ncbi:MAG: phenylacetyl-CoA:acceptor oxidoreductase [Betaproteobacteria bacterium HGW-Betaproteobacteria-19]|nr:MAG: phenylacetyl-CoA:acceptor oxidoreductase [Betaproteobacteria bacterium HGW-Betaproteobacteria-19]